MPTKFLNLSTDTTLGGATPSDELAVSQKAIKTALDTKVAINSSAQSKAYGTSSTGAETTWKVAGGATANTLAYRGTGGVLQVGTPTSDTHATTKKYVDDALATKADTSSLGTAAYTASTDYATAAQGAKADTAVQPAVMQAALDTKAPLDTFLAPNFDGLTPIATYEFDTSSTSFYKLLTFNNIYATTEAIPVAHALFRITATIGGKTSIINAIVETQKALTYMRVLSNHTTGYTATGNTGVRYIRTAVPKALNDGHDWELDISTYTATARHIKVEVFQSDNGFTWFADGSTSTITTSTHTSSTITYYTAQGTIIHPALNASVTSASTAAYITSRLSKWFPGTMPLAAEALLPYQICFLSDNSVYPSTNTNVAINTDVGLMATYNGGVNAGAVPNYYNINQKEPMANLDAVPHATLTRGDPCYFRCTMDANGNIKSDNYVATEMTPGYTWCYIGIASSATAIMVDTTSSVFLTLDANGKLTHVNGKKLAGGGGGGSVDIDNLTITENASQEIQAVATVNANTASGATNPIYDWVGTLAEYTAQNIETTHPDWLCYITDDVSGGASVYTKAQVDASFVAKGHQVIEFQEPTSANGYTWYRKYADGWVEQGGSFSSGGSGNKTITLLVEMVDLNYKAKATRFSGASTTTNVNVWAREATSTTQFVIYASGDTGVAWEVKGMAA